MSLTKGGEFRSRGSAYAAALWCVLAAFGLRQWLEADLGPGIPPYALFYPVVMLATLLGGLGPGLAATALSAVVSAHWILGPGRVGRLFDAGETVGLGLFVGVCLVVAGAAEWHRLTRRQAPASWRANWCSAGRAGCAARERSADAGGEQGRARA